jgi:ABC-type antimicrobial peptide transport system permease subunit
MTPKQAENIVSTLERIEAMPAMKPISQADIDWANKQNSTNLTSAILENIATVQAPIKTRKSRKLVNPVSGEKLNLKIDFDSAPAPIKTRKPRKSKTRKSKKLARQNMIGVYAAASLLVGSIIIFLIVLIS